MTSIENRIRNMCIVEEIILSLGETRTKSLGLESINPFARDKREQAISELSLITIFLVSFTILIPIS